MGAAKTLDEELDLFAVSENANDDLFGGIGSPGGRCDSARPGPFADLIVRFSCACQCASV